MGWRFRKSFSPFPGIRLNFSPRGISTSIGVGPLRVYLGPQGPAVTARIPGTGIAFRQPLGLPKPEGQGPADSQPQPVLDVATPELPIAAEIRSASTTALTSEGLEPLKELLVKAQEERSRLIPELRDAKAEAARLKARHERWTNGILFRRVFKKYFARLGELATEAAEKEAELEEQERQSRLATEFALPDTLKDVFGHLCDATATLSSSQHIWDTLSRRTTDRYRERTTAQNTIERKPVTIALGSCDLIETSGKVPHLTNANGGEMFVYPGFVLYHVSSEAFALVDMGEVALEFESVSFIEEESVPGDSQIVGQTWKKANKNGFPDRRFANNYQIPVVLYGGIRITSKGGLNEEYMISNASAAETFAKAWLAFRDALPRAGA